MAFGRDNRSGGRSFSGGGRSFGPRNDDRGFGRGGFGAPRGDREMFKTVCSNCGKDCEVPFRPTNGKPVYCSECFEKMGNTRSDSGRDERPSFRSQAPAYDSSKAQLDAINVKLDKILKMLEVKNVVVEPASVKDSSKAKEVKAPRVKKPAKV